MKILLWALLFVCTSIASFGQNLNEILYRAVSVGDTVQVASLLKKGADANFIENKGKIGMTMLTVAVNARNFKIVKLLVDNHASIDARDDFKSTPLMYAAYVGNMDIVKYLLKNGADVNAKDDSGNSVFSGAKEGKHQDVIDLISKLIKQ